MKIRFVSIAVLLAFASTLSFAMETQPVRESAEVTPPASTPDGATGKQRKTTIEEIRAGVAASGVDLDTPQGKLLVDFTQRALNDPGARAYFLAPGMRVPDPFRFSAEDRLRFLHALDRAGNATPGDCEGWATYKDDMFALAGVLSPEAFRNALVLSELMIFPREVASDEQFTTAGLIDAAGQLSAALVRSGVDPDIALQTPIQRCKVVHATRGVIDAMPEPVQRNASMEFMRVMLGQPTATGNVLANPEAYLDQAFDERQLPESGRRQLPADGSRPLPFKRLVVDGEWVSQTPGQSGPMRGIYINRRNNGVVSQLVTSGVRLGKPARVDFTLNYGSSLRWHAVAMDGAARLVDRPDDQAIEAMDGPLVKGATISFRAPQSLPDGSTWSQQCRIGDSRPASSVFPSLSGTAIEMQCSSQQAGENARELGVAWLPDYRFGLTLSSKAGNETTRLVIHNITIDDTAAESTQKMD